MKECQIDMNAISSRVNLKIIALGSYDCVIGMDWLEKNYYIMDYYNMAFTCLDGEWKQSIMQ